MALPLAYGGFAARARAPKVSEFGRDRHNTFMYVINLHFHF